MNLALFDFDGTLTTKDTLDEFLRFSVGLKTYYIKLLLFSPIFILYKLKIIKNDIAKQKLISLFFKGFKEDKFKALAQEYSMKNIDLVIREDIYQRFQEHISNGDKVIVVSASLQCWLQPWCDKHEVQLLSTRLEFVEGHITGKFATKNCHGQEKVERLEQELDINDYESIYAYGDSSGDTQMLKIADYPTKVK